MFMPVSLQNSIGFKLLRYVFGIYCIITIILTFGHLLTEYENEKKKLFNFFHLHQRSLTEPLTNSVWHLDIIQLQNTLAGVIEFPLLIGASVQGAQGELFTRIGTVSEQEKALTRLHINYSPPKKTVTFQSELFSHRFDLVQRNYGTEELIGTVVLYSNREALYHQLYSLFSKIIIIAIIKTLLLWWLFIYFGRRFLSRPLDHLLEKISEFYHHNSQHDLPMLSTGNELQRLETAFDLLTHKLDETMEHLIQESKSKSLFLANMSHEIRTPLNAINGMSYLLQQSPLNEKQQHFLSTLQTSNKYVTMLINDLLDISKIEAGKLKIVDDAFQISELIDTLSSSVGSLDQRSNNELFIMVEHNTPPFIKGDSMRVTQVLINLVGNAFKFSKGKSVVVTIKVKQRSERAVTLCFDVIDQGIGMSQDQIETVFGLFQQADATTTRIFGGTGLGLTISKRLVDAMGGGIKVTSTLKKGSDFSVTIPFKLIENFDTQSEVKTEQQQPLHILFVHPVSIVLNAMADIGNSYGWQIDTFEKREDTLSYLQSKQKKLQNHYDIILLDGQIKETEIVDITKISGEPYSPILILGPSQHVDPLITLNRYQLDFPITSLGIQQKINDILTKSSPAQQQPTEPQTHPIPEIKHLLVVDDQRINREIVIGMLEPYHLTISQASNGQEAVELCSRNPYLYDAIFIDIQMPLMDGYAATQAIHAINPDIPVIALTAHAFEEERQRTLEAGMNAHISKPFSDKQLINELNRLILASSQQRDGNKAHGAKQADGIHKLLELEQLIEKNSFQCAAALKNLNNLDTEANQPFYQQLCVELNNYQFENARETLRRLKKRLTETSDTNENKK